VSYFVIAAGVAVVFTAVGGGASPWQFALTGFVTVVIILCLNMVGQGVLLMGGPRLLFGAAVIERVLQLAIAAASPLLAGLFSLSWYVVWIAYLDCVVIMTYPICASLRKASTPKRSPPCSTEITAALVARPAAARRRGRCRRPRLTSRWVHG